MTPRHLLRFRFPVKIFPLFLLVALVLTTVGQADSRSLYHRSNSVRSARKSLPNFGPRAKEHRYDKRMVRAAEIAAERARARSTARCWRYVKSALLAANVVHSYPQTAYAKQAGTELATNHGFQRINIRNPFEAPVGAVLVYGGRGAGHVEIRTGNGFVSDFHSFKPSPRPLIGVFVKPS